MNRVTDNGDGSFEVEQGEVILNARVTELRYRIDDLLVEYEVDLMTVTPLSWALLALLLPEASS